jgi:hypothetical protein
MLGRLSCHCVCGGNIYHNTSSPPESDGDNKLFICNDLFFCTPHRLTVPCDHPHFYPQHQLLEPVCALIKPNYL